VIEQKSPERAVFAGSDADSESSTTPDGFLGVPLKFNLQVSGVLLLQKAQEQFDEHDIQFASALAHVAGMAIDHSRSIGEIQRMALIDDLTGAFNRNFFNRAFAEDVARARRMGYPLGLLFVDVDGLKAINDNHGHPVGDEVLKAVVDALRRSLRETDWVARFGGDEFAVVLAGCTAPHLNSVVKKLSWAITNTTLSVSRGPQLSLRVSIGGAVLPENAANATELLRTANQAEREAKSAAGNQVRVRLAGKQEDPSAPGGAQHGPQTELRAP
jgi:diguanylate cyclase (GGDEF)-like protein